MSHRALFADNAASAYQGVSSVSSDFWGSPVLRNETTGKLYCPGFVGETFSKNTWDTVVFGGVAQTPGLCTVSVSKSQDVDIKKSKGSDGATVTPHGLMPAEVQIAITIWTPQQLVELNKLWALIMPKAGKSSGEAFDVSYPSLKTHGIKSVMVTRGEGLAPADKRARTFTIHCIEFAGAAVRKRKATKTLVEAKGSTLDPKTESAGQAPARPKPGTFAKNTKP